MKNEDLVVNLLLRWCSTNDFIFTREAFQRERLTKLKGSSRPLSTDPGLIEVVENELPPSLPFPDPKKEAATKASGSLCVSLMAQSNRRYAELEKKFLEKENENNDKALRIEQLLQQLLLHKKNLYKSADRHIDEAAANGTKVKRIDLQMVERDAFKAEVEKMSARLEFEKNEVKRLRLLLSVKEGELGTSELMVKNLRDWESNATQTHGKTKTQLNDVLVDLEVLRNELSSNRKASESLHHRLIARIEQEAMRLKESGDFEGFARVVDEQMQEVDVLRAQNTAKGGIVTNSTNLLDKGRSMLAANSPFDWRVSTQDPGKRIPVLRPTLLPPLDDKLASFAGNPKGDRSPGRDDPQTANSETNPTSFDSSERLDKIPKIEIMPLSESRQILKKTVASKFPTTLTTTVETQTDPRVVADMGVGPGPMVLFEDMVCDFEVTEQQETEPEPAPVQEMKDVFEAQISEVVVVSAVEVWVLSHKNHLRSLTSGRRVPFGLADFSGLAGEAALRNVSINVSQGQSPVYDEELLSKCGSESGGIIVVPLHNDANTVVGVVVCSRTEFKFLEGEQRDVEKICHALAVDPIFEGQLAVGLVGPTGASATGRAEEKQAVRLPRTFSMPVNTGNADSADPGGKPLSKLGKRPSFSSVREVGSRGTEASFGLSAHSFEDDEIRSNPSDTSDMVLFKQRMKSRIS